MLPSLDDTRAADSLGCLIRAEQEYNAYNRLRHTDNGRQRYLVALTETKHIHIQIQYLDPYRWRVYLKLKEQTVQRT